MAFIIERDEATAARRRVPFRLFLSDGTSPDLNASNGTILLSVNGAAQIVSAGSISVVSANAGMYYNELSQSNVSVLGSIALYTDTIATDFPQHVANVQVVNFNPMSLQSGVIIAGGSYSSTTVRLDLISYSGATVGAGNFAPGTYSAVSFSIRNGGIQPVSVGVGNYSGVSVEVKTGGIQTNSIGVGNYSGVSVDIRAGTHSGVTVQGVTRTLNLSTNDDKTGYNVSSIDGAARNLIAVNSADSVWKSNINAFSGLSTMGQIMNAIGARHGQVADVGPTASDFDVDGFTEATNDHFNGMLMVFTNGVLTGQSNIITDYVGASQNCVFATPWTEAPADNDNFVIMGVRGITRIVPATYSDATVRIEGVSYSGATIDGVRIIATAGERSIASSWMSTNFGQDRYAQEALFALRNRVQISGSTGTVFHPDDATSAWTFSVTTTTFSLSGIDPGGL